MMALAAAGAIAGSVGSVLSSTIGAISENAKVDKQIASSQQMQGVDIEWQKQKQNLDIQNQQKLQSGELQNRLDVTNLSGLTNRDVANISGQWASQNNLRTTQTQLQLQTNEFQQSNWLRENLVNQLKSAGLPEYLAYVQPDESMLQTRRVAGHNVTLYKGTNMHLYGLAK